MPATAEMVDAFALFVVRLDWATELRALATVPPPLPPPKKPLAVGGNHEAANYLWELYHGGWAAPGIFFMGYAGVVRFGGVRIGGLSGIFKEQHYTMVGGWVGAREAPGKGCEHVLACLLLR